VVAVAEDFIQKIPKRTEKDPKEDNVVRARSLPVVTMVATKVTLTQPLSHVLFGNNFLQKYKPSLATAECFNRYMTTRWPMEKYNSQAHSGPNFLMVPSMS
jgi:hypothetical protein